MIAKLDEEELGKYKKAALKFLYLQHAWVHKHRSFDTVLRKFPRDKQGFAKQAIKSLIRDGYVLYYDRSRKALILNVNLKKEIEEFIETQIRF